MVLNYSFAICENNKIYCWGFVFGNMRIGNIMEDRNKPVELKIDGTFSPIKQIICGRDFTFAICENNKIYCWE